MSEGISALLGLFTPLLINLMNKHVQDKKVKNWIAQGTCVAVGVVVAFLTNQFDTTNILASVGIVSGLANLTYKQYFQDKFSK